MRTGIFHSATSIALAWPLFGARREGPSGEHRLDREWLGHEHAETSAPPFGFDFHIGLRRDGGPHPTYTVSQPTDHRRGVNPAATWATVQDTTSRR